MDPQIDTNPPTDGNDGTPPEPEVTDWQAEAEKWKAHSKKHEKNWQTASKERDQLRAASMTDAEKAIQDAETRGRQAARAETSSERVQLKLEAAAAVAGADVKPLLARLNTASFLTDGEVDETAIGEFVATLPTANKPPKFAQGLGIGPQSDQRNPGQLTRADLPGMTPREIAQARKDGRLDALMRGQ